MVAFITHSTYIFIIFYVFFDAIKGEFSYSKKCPRKSGKFPIPGSFCASYYICENWKIQREEYCPLDQNFNPNKEWCDYKDLYPCLEKPRRKECPRSNGRFLKNGTECEKYFDCCNGEPTEKRCPKGQLFDAESGKCDWEELVECDGSSKNKDCRKPNGKFLKPKTKCRTYFECSKGKSKEKTCPKHQLFNTKSGKCDWRERVTCDEEMEKRCIKPTGNFLKPGTKCKVYFDCYKGRASEKKCPENKLFDSKQGKCNWEKLVTCQDEDKSSESSSSESDESNESSSVTYSPPNTFSEELTSGFTKEEVKSSSPITDSVTEEVKSPAPITDSTTEEVKSPLPNTDSTIEVKSPPPITDSTTEDAKSPLPISDSTIEEAKHTSPVTDFTTDNAKSPSTIIDSTTEELKSPSPITDSITEEVKSSTQEISISPEITEQSSHPTLDELSSDLPTIIDLISTSTNEDTLSSESESTLEHTTSETTIEDNLTSTNIPTEDFDISTVEDISSSFQTEHPSSTKKTTIEEISTDSVQTQRIFETTQPSSIDDIIDSTSSLATKNDIFSSSTTIHESTIDPVLVGFVCPEANGYYPHPTNKHKFIGCVHKNAYIMDCPHNLVYNSDQKKCLYN